MIINKSYDLLKSIVQKSEFSDVELIKLPNASTAVKNVKNVESFLVETQSYNVYYETEDKECFAVTNKGIFTFNKPPSQELLSEFELEYRLKDCKKLDDTRYVYTLSNNPIITMNMINESPFAFHRYGLRKAENEQIQLAPLSSGHSFVLPDTKEYATEWFLHSKYEHELYNKNSSLNCDAAWEALGSYGNEDVVIGVVDSGFDLNCSHMHRCQHKGYMYFSGQRLVSSLDPSGKNNTILHLNVEIPILMKKT